MSWEMFYDDAYYGHWAVRPIGDTDFNSPRLFHFNLKTEAEKLLLYLNSICTHSDDTRIKIEHIIEDRLDPQFCYENLIEDLMELVRP